MKIQMSFFLLSLAPELRKITVNKGQLKIQLMSLIVNWEEGQQHQTPRQMSPYQFSSQYIPHVETYKYVPNPMHSLSNYPNFASAPSHSWGNANN